MDFIFLIASTWKMEYQIKSNDLIKQNKSTAAAKQLIFITGMSIVSLVQLRMSLSSSKRDINMFFADIVIVI